MNKANILSSIYYDPKNPGSFGSAPKLLLEARKQIPDIKLVEVKDWLSGELTYTLHKNARRNYKRLKYFVTNPLEQFQADLVDMQPDSRHNNGFKYILTVIDCFTKYAFAIPLKNKTGQEVLRGLKIVFNEKIPQKLQTDRGKEFLNQTVQKYLKENQIHFFTTYNTKFKCAIIERFNGTLKRKMYKYFTSRGSRKYIDILQDLIDSYNTTEHRTIKARPIDVTDSNKNFIFQNIYGYTTPRNYIIANKSKPNIQPGDFIRRKYELNSLDKRLLPNWTDEIFEVKKSIKSQSRPMFQIQSQSSNVIPHRLYSEEVQKIKKNLYRIEKIVKKEKRNGKKGFIVKWTNYSPKYNSWVPEEDLISFNARARNSGIL